MTLTEFLLARIAEDERGSAGVVMTRRDLAECEAKRRILELHGGGMHRCITGRVTWPSECMEARILATVYADQPDYREEWKP